MSADPRVSVSGLFSDKKEFVVDGDGLLHFRDAEALQSFLALWPALGNDSLYGLWAYNSGVQTDYANYLRVSDLFDSLLQAHVPDPRMTEERFAPIFREFAFRYGHLARISSEGIQPRYRFPYHYFVDKDGRYRVGGRLYTAPASAVAGFLPARDERCEFTCTTKLENDKKRRIRVTWVSETFRQAFPADPSDPHSPLLTNYWWIHMGEVKAQRRIFGIWFREKRHIALDVSAQVRNVHYHPSIPVDTTYNIDFFKCAWTYKIRQQFATDVFTTLVNSPLNKVEGIVDVTGTNRLADCSTVQASCTIDEALDCE